MPTTTEIARKIVDEIGFGKLTGSLRLTDYDPLIVIMFHVNVKIENRGKSLNEPGARKVWLKVIEELQANNSHAEHNPYLPCRQCNQMFDPVVDEDLLKLFYAWYQSMAPQDLLAIHRCPSCGGRLKAKRTKTYNGDFHTPAPGSVNDDEEWADLLLKHSGL